MRQTTLDLRPLLVYTRSMNHTEFLETLRKHVHESGSQRAYCRKKRIAVSHLYYLLSGQRVPTDKLLRRIGFKRTIDYTETK